MNRGKGTKRVLTNVHSLCAGSYFSSLFAVFLMSRAGARAANDGMNAVAVRYAHLVLALGQHDPDYVDAFYGPAGR